MSSESRVVPACEGPSDFTAQIGKTHKESEKWV